MSNISLDGMNAECHLSGLVDAVGVGRVNSVLGRLSRLGSPIAILCLTSIFSSQVMSAEQMCFLPMKGLSGSSTNFVDPKSKVCRAFQRELNANCAGAIPSVEFIPKLPDSGLNEPAWKAVPLYTANGEEIADAFALLEELILGRGLGRYSKSPEIAARRDMELLLDKVRKSKAGDRIPRLERTSLDLEGRGRKEVVYRLYTGFLRNPTSLNEQGSLFKSEPELFLDRARSTTHGEMNSEISPQAWGSDVTRPADVILFEGVPYFLTWSGGKSLLIYASYLQSNPPKIPEEVAEQRTFILPHLRCLFDVRPTSPRI